MSKPGAAAAGHLAHHVAGAPSYVAYHLLRDKFGQMARAAHRGGAAAGRVITPLLPAQPSAAAAYGTQMFDTPEDEQSPTGGVSP